MARPTEDTTGAAENGSNDWKRFAFWPLLLLLYTLGAGPAWMLKDKMADHGMQYGPAGLPVRLLMVAYKPVEWAHEHTPLHKPLGKYLHLWSRDFDKNGDRLYWLA